MPGLAEADLAAFLEEARQEHAAAVAVTGGLERDLRVAGRRLRLRFAGATLADALLPALRPRLAGPGGTPDVTIGLWEEGAAGVRPRPAPWGLGDLGPRGLVGGSTRGSVVAVHEGGSEAITLFDRRTGALLYRVPDARTLPWWERAQPLRPALFWALSRSDRHLVHAGAVGDDDRGGVLLAGRGGSGKTTVALAALAGGLRYVADDYLLLDTVAEPVAWNLYGTAKFEPADRARFGELGAAAAHPDGGEAGQKSVLDVAAVRPESLAESLAVRAVVVPSIAGGRSVLRRVSAGAALRALAPSTAFQMPYDGGAVLRSLARVVRRVPCFELRVGDRLTELAGGVDRVLDEAIAIDGPAMTSSPVAASPLVSVIVPAYQAERFLAQALRSALAQERVRAEVIVVDDGSTDGTARIADGHPVRLLRRAHAGIAAARNAGLAAARGDFVTFLDADDVWPPDRLWRQLAYLDAHPEVGIVLGLTEVFLNPGDPWPRAWANVTDGEVLPSVAGSMLARREAFDRIGIFDESLRVCEDIDWLARAKDARIRAGSIDHVVLRYRVHTANTTQDTRGIHAGLLTVLRGSLRRQRELARG